MQKLNFILATLLFTTFSAYSKIDSVEWKKIEREHFYILYTASDESSINTIIDRTETGIKTIEGFFKHPFKKKFRVQVFPDRNALDAFW